MSGQPQASFRHQSLWLDSGPVAIYTSHLTLDLASDSFAHARGIADGLALRLKHSNLSQHYAAMPENSIAAILFDSLEQIRVEALVDNKHQGSINNLEESFTHWQRNYIDQGLTENQIGLVIFTVIQVVRSKLTGVMPDREITPILEEPQFHLMPLVGEELQQLRKHRLEQKLYARYALRLVTIIADFLQLDAHDRTNSAKSKIPLPKHRPTIQSATALKTKQNSVADQHEFSVTNYHVFTDSYDRIVNGAKLYSTAKQIELRKRLELEINKVSVNISQLAQRLKLLFGLAKRSSWNFNQEYGQIDGSRLSQLIANPGYQSIFKQDRMEPTCDLVVSFLIDNSGSMKIQRYENVALLVDIYSRALELAGAKTEILGFTTNSWNGGRSLQQWRKAGQPANPGRLNEGLFIIYKDADTPWQRARFSIASMLNTLHYREGIDGEALQWAANRQAKRSEKRKVLVLISDGAPMDSATANANDAGYLAQHLADVANQIETRSDINLSAIGIDQDMGQFIENHSRLELAENLDHSAFNVLHELYAK